MPSQRELLALIKKRKGVTFKQLRKIYPNTNTSNISGMIKQLIRYKFVVVEIIDDKSVIKPR